MIDLYGVNDVRMDGLLLAGGRSEIVTRQGEYVGRQLTHYDVDSEIRVRADRQLIIGTDLTAGKKIDLKGGNDTRAPSQAAPYDGSGLVLLGSVSLNTLRDNSVIAVSAPDRIDILAPADLNELVLPDWPVSANGVLSNNVRMIAEVDKIGYKIQAIIDITAASTAGYTAITQLQAALNAQLLGAQWRVTQSQGGNLPALGTVYTGLATVPNFSQSQPDVAVKFREGKLRLVGPYELKVLASTVHAGTSYTSSGADLGLSFPTGTTAYSSIRRFSINAPGAGSVINIGVQGGDNGLQYIAGKLRAYSAINLYSSLVDLDYTGVLETINGSIGFTAGSEGVIKGSVIAGGAGSDVLLNSARSLTVLGTIQAADRVELRGGDGQRISSGSLTITNAATQQQDVLPGFYSLVIQNTARIVTTDAGGSLSLVGTNNVLIDGAVVTQQSSVPLSIESELGLLNLNRSSGRIEAAGALTLKGFDVTLDGPITSNHDNALADGSLASYEVQVIAQRNALLRGNLHAAKDIRIQAGGLAEFYDNLLTASTLRVEAAAAYFGSPISASAATQKGSRIEVVNRLHLTANDLGVYAGALLLSKGVQSDITLTAGTALFVGTVHAGAELLTTNGSSQAQVVSQSNASLNISASDSIRLGVGANGSTTPPTVANDANLLATGSLNLVGGSGLSQQGLGLWVSGASRVALVDDGRTGVSRALSLSSARDLRIDGFVQSQATGGTVSVQAARMVTVNGVIQGYNTVSLAGGQSDSSGLSLSTSALIYRMNSQRGATAAGTYFVDADGRWMDASGRLALDASANIVTEGNSLSADRISTNADPADKQFGGAPIRLNGAIIDTAQGGTIGLSSGGKMRLEGAIGQLYETSTPGVLAPRVNSVTITGSTQAQTQIYADIYANNRIAITGSDINLYADARLDARSSSAQVEVVAEQTLFIQGASGNADAAIIRSNDWIHLRGSEIHTSGSLSAQNRIWLNAARDVYIWGLIDTRASASGKVDVRAGLATSHSDAAARSTEADEAALSAMKDTLGTGSIYMLEAAQLRTHGIETIRTGTLNLLAGEDVVLDAGAISGGSRTISVPVISTETVTY